MTAFPSVSIRIAAVGDLLLTTRPGASASGRGLEALSEEIRQLFASCDIVLANLECTLPGKDRVPTEPRVFTTEAQINKLRDVGINVVTLGNNHAFDAGEEGYRFITKLLTEGGITFFGAGMNLTEAIHPTIITVNGIRVTIIGTVDKSSGMHCFAGKTTSGVAPLETKSLCQQIKKLAQETDHVIVSPHWGDERFRFPSPHQIGQAHAFIDAGASMVLGHHPHVIQGMEFYQKAPIVYSLGNFLANPVYWDNGDRLTWSRFERTGCILLVELDQTGIRNVQQIPVLDDGKSISIDTSGQGKRYLDTANRLLTQGVTLSRYRRETFRVKTLLPIWTKLRWSKLHQIRPRHFKKGVRLFFRC